MSKISLVSLGLKSTEKKLKLPLRSQSSLKKLKIQKETFAG